MLAPSIVINRYLVAAGLAAISVFLLGCGSGGSGSTAARPQATAAAGSPPTVFAAASLTKVLPEIDPRAKYTFGGSGALAAEIQQGAPADVFVAASSKQPAALFAKGLVGKPVKFATNTLVLIVPKGNPARIISVGDITRPGVKLVICNATVPCGDYARTALSNLNIARAAFKNVVSEATDVSQVLADVALGQADAGFVYLTDADAGNGRVLAIRLPVRAKPLASDYIAVVRSSAAQASANAFVQQLLSARGQAILRAHGFGKP